MSFVPMSIAPITVVGGVPLFVALYNTNTGYAKWSNSFAQYYVGKGSRLAITSLVLVLTAWAIDDWGTAIGIQANEVPLKLFEGNPIMVNAWEQMKDWGIAKTDTAAMRLIYIGHLATILVAQYMGWLNPASRFFLFFAAIIKVVAGLGWWFLSPNPYSLSDFLSFKDGKATPHRHSLGNLTLYNEQVERPYRRRLGTAANDTEILLTDLFYYMFPMI